MFDRMTSRRAAVFGLESRLLTGLVRGSNSGGGMEIFSSPKVQTDSVAHPASYLMGTRVSLQAAS
jgi:hypothetical protein